MNDIFKLNEKYKIALNAARICIFGVDIINQKYLFFDNAEMIYKKSGKEILKDIDKYSKLSPEEYTKSVSAYFTHPEDFSAVSEAFEKVLNGLHSTYYARMRTSDNKYNWCKVDVMPIIIDGTPKQMLGVVSHLDHLINQSEKYKEEATLDILTKLYNKNHFKKEVEKYLTKEKTGALIIIDIDDFKKINDTRGHFEGDVILTKFAAELRNIFPSHILGRFGGDEFVAYIHNCRLAENLLARLINVVNSILNISISAGIAECDNEHSNFDLYFINADQALYEAKKKKNSYQLYESK